WSGSEVAGVFRRRRRSRLSRPTRRMVGAVDVQTQYAALEREERPGRGAQVSGRFQMRRHLLVAITLASTLIATTASAQLAPYNDAGATMGHWHIAAKDVEANKRLFLAMGG